MNGKEIIIYSLVFGILAVDKVPGALTMLSAPLVSNAVLGWLLERYFGMPNAFVVGLILGTIFSLLWLSHLPVGAYFPPNNNFGAAFALVLAAQLNVSSSSLWEAIGYAVVIGIPTTLLAAKVEMLVRNINVYTKKKVEIQIEKGHFWAINFAIFWGILVYLLWNGVLMGILLFSTQGVLVKLYSLLLELPEKYILYLPLGVAFILVYTVTKGYILFTYRRFWYIFWCAVFGFIGILTKNWIFPGIAVLTITVYAFISKRMVRNA